MALVRRIPTLALFLLVACGKGEATCPPGTNLVDGRCLTSCRDPADCLAGEICVMGACVQGMLKDAGFFPDAQPRPDANMSVDAGPDCHSLDEQSCGATKDCRPVSCRQGCSNAETFTSCAFKDEPTNCPPQACDCSTLGEDACLRTDRFCVPRYCSSCEGTAVFGGCFLVSQMLPTCPSVCPSCRTKPQCENQGCAAILNPAPEPGCNCDVQHPRCCQTFNHCSIAPASCPILTDCAQPPPVCSDETTPAAENGCWVGCVAGARCSI